MLGLTISKSTDVKNNCLMLSSTLENFVFLCIKSIKTLYLMHFILKIDIKSTHKPLTCFVIYKFVYTNKTFI